MPDIPALLRARPYMFALLLSSVLLVANVLAEPNFGDPANWPSQLAAFAPLALVAIASTPAVLSGPGHIDLSIGPLAVLCNVLLVQTLFPNGIDSAWECVPLLLALGTAVGAINGVLVAYLRFQPVIATLCTFFVINGLNLKIGASPKAPPEGNWTVDLADTIGPIPGAVLLIGVPALIWLALSRTAYHRTLYAVGGNDATAFSAGVDVARTRASAFALGGLFAAIAGIALTALVQSGQGASGGTYVLIALAGVALGGTQFTGGRGGLTGSILGALCIYLIQTLLSSLSVPPSWLQVVYGAMLLAGVLVGGKIMMSRPKVVVA